MDLNEERARVYQVIGDIIMKFIFSIAAIIAFFIVLFKYLDTHTVFDAAKYGAIEFLLGGSVFIAFRHFFPPKNENNNR